MECGCNPGIITLHKSQQVKNADNTGDDNPVVCNAWIDYWKTFTMEDIPDVCPLCGEPMTDDDSKGCHVLIKSQSAMAMVIMEQPNTSFPGIISAIVSLARSLN